VSQTANVDFRSSFPNRIHAVDQAELWGAEAYVSTYFLRNMYSAPCEQQNHCQPGLQVSSIHGWGLRKSRGAAARASQQASKQVVSLRTESGKIGRGNRRIPFGRESQKFVMQKSALYQNSTQSVGWLTPRTRRTDTANPRRKVHVGFPANQTEGFPETPGLMMAPSPIGALKLEGVLIPNRST